MAAKSEFLPPNTPVPPAIRWLAGITGIIAMVFAYMIGAGGNPFTTDWFSAHWYETVILLIWLGLPVLMTAGAIAAGKSHRIGRVFMSAGAVFASAFLVPYGVAIVFSRWPLDVSALSILALGAATVVLVVWCDVVLVKEARSSSAKCCITT